MAGVLAFLAVGQPAGATARRPSGTPRPHIRTATSRVRNGPMPKAGMSRQIAAAPMAAGLVASVVSPPAGPVASVADVVTSAPVRAPAEIDYAHFARLQAILDTWTRAAPGVESMTVAVRIGGHSWESAARQDGRPAPDPAARYRVMSITKTVTAALVLRAVEEGKLSLDAPLPRLDGVGAAVPQGITVRRLLAHRSGLADYTEAPGYLADQPMTPERAAELSLSAPVVSAPGTATRYVNSNYLVLGLLLQQVHHRPYADLVADLTGPLGLIHTRVEPPERPGWAGFSSGGIMSTVGDMARWGDALFTPGRVVSGGSLAVMATTGDLEGGLGLWGVCPCADGVKGVDRFTAIGHFTAAGVMLRFPSSGMTLVMKAEPASGDTIARAVSLAAALLGELSS